MRAESAHRPGARHEGEPDTTLVPPEVRRSVSILVVDDERTLRESCAMLLDTEGYRVEACGRGPEALELVKRRRYDVVLCDLYMPDVTGMDLLKATLAAEPGTIVIIMTGRPSVSSNVEVLRAGAWDYLTKPFTGTQLQIVVGRAAHTVLVARESAAQAEAPEALDSNLLGSAPSFRRALDIARRVAPTDASVFISGESGTGKEMIAQLIHRLSRRSARPLVAVNCAALPEGLLESEMFGHVKGAFTGAVKEKVGLIETANGGTFLLDELIDMPKSIQAKLLRVIQDGVVRRVGSSTTSAVANVRFISASNRNPDQALKDGTLREDLYYRLRVVPIFVPPLRERPADVQLLAQHFLETYWRRHREASEAVPTLSEGALEALCRRPWPGNVRELQNVIEHCVVMVEPGQRVEAEQLPREEGEIGTPAGPQDEAGDMVAPGLFGQSFHAAREQVVAVFERRYLTTLINRAGGNMSKAARLAGIDRATLYRLVERHGLQREMAASHSE